MNAFRSCGVTLRYGLAAPVKTGGGGSFGADCRAADVAAGNLIVALVFVLGVLSGGNSLEEAGDASVDLLNLRRALSLSPFASTFADTVVGVVIDCESGNGGCAGRSRGCVVCVSAACVSWFASHSTIS